MARPSARDRVLAAAGTCFYRDGLDRTTMQDIAAEADAALGTVYAHFGSKEQLVGAYLQDRDRAWERTWDDAVSAATTPAAAVLAVFDALQGRADVMRADRGCAEQAVLHQVGEDHAAREVARSHKAAMVQRIARSLEGLVEDPAATAVTIHLLVEGALAASVTGAVTEPFHAARAAAAALIGGERAEDDAAGA